MDGAAFSQLARHEYVPFLVEAVRLASLRPDDNAVCHEGSVSARFPLLPSPQRMTSR